MKNKRNTITIYLGLWSQLLAPFILWYIVYTNVQIGYLLVANVAIACAGGMFVAHTWYTLEPPSMEPIVSLSSGRLLYRYTLVWTSCEELQTVSDNRYI